MLRQLPRPTPLAAFITGCLVTACASWLVRDVRADSLVLNPVTMIHVCTDSKGSMHMAELPMPCPAGEQSAFLKKAEADVDTSDATDKKDGAAKASSSDDARAQALDQRIQEIEEQAKKGELGNKVVAPFEVVDPGGRRVFYVEDGFVRLYNAASSEVASMVATDSGGNFVARSTDGSRRVSVGAGMRDGAGDAGMIVQDNGGPRVIVGRRGDGSYLALFQTADGKRVAGIGQSAAGRGAAYVADAQGNVRSVMRMDPSGKPVIGITFKGDPDAGTFLASLSEGLSGGGKLTLYDASGKTPMVEAGSTDDGVGVVRAGPDGFKPGLGVLGLPSSFISGKP